MSEQLTLLKNQLLAYYLHQQKYQPAIFFTEQRESCHAFFVLSFELCHDLPELLTVSLLYDRFVLKGLK